MFHFLCVLGFYCYLHFDPDFGILENIWNESWLDCVISAFWLDDIGFCENLLIHATKFIPEIICSIEMEIDPLCSSK